MLYPRLHFHGAAHGVTGSCFEIETEETRILVDCGMFQGSKSEARSTMNHSHLNPRQ